MHVTIENDTLRWVIADTGDTVHFIDRASGADYGSCGPVATVSHAGGEARVTGVERDGDELRLRFGGAGIDATVRVEERGSHVALEVAAVNGPADSFAFLDVPLTLSGDPGEAFAACMLALNLKTDVQQVPQASSHLRAVCHSRIGLTGARAALVASPTEHLRDALKEAVSGAPDVPKSSVGGPWALDEPRNTGSYVFNTTDLTTETVDEWIDLARSLGFTQIDFHGGQSFRFGDIHPSPELYPNGHADLRAVIDRLHDAGIQAGLHTYAFFIDKACPWVTPKPDPRLASDAVFTLTSALTAEDTDVPVAESTSEMSAITGFFVRNSVTLRIDDELITYSGVSAESPYGFTGCERGACGTLPAPHDAGARVYHLKECFGLFVPDPETDMLTEVAQRAADAYNACGFDMIYLDALDGEDVLGGTEWSWHYGSRFVWELAERLDRPALMEMSTFHHHLWYVRARHGAWDHPTKSHKRFIDLHIESNDTYDRMFLPTNLGWWSVETWLGAAGEPTHSDDMEYLCAKAIGTGSGLSLMGITPETLRERPVLERFASIFQRYETLRIGGAVSPAVLDQLRRPGAEFTLDGDHFRPVAYTKRTAETGASAASWTLDNPYEPQMPRVRIESLPLAGPYDGDSVVALGFDEDVPDYALSCADGVTGTLESAAPDADAPLTDGILRVAASNAGDTSRGAWMGATFALEPLLDLSGHEGIGFWVRGDGSGALLNVQIRCPEHLISGIGEHYVTLDFSGWRYVSLVESEGERYSDYEWPYGHAYSIYREGTVFDQISSIGVWLNDVPAGGEVDIRLSTIRGVPLLDTPLVNPVLSVGGSSVMIERDIATGEYVELWDTGHWLVFGREGEDLGEAATQGIGPRIATGANDVVLSASERARARVTVGTVGDEIG